jgi:hypothetical protein
MAHCHYLFSNFNQIIRLTEERRQALMTARDDLKQRIIASFNNNKSRLPSVHELQFQTQGSFIMDTIINPISEDYDLDYGVYFIGNLSKTQRPAAQEFHNFVKLSVETNNPSVLKVMDKDTCVRAMYKEGFNYLFENRSNKLTKGFHVDLPMYYSTTKKSPDLAHLKKFWPVSDPIEFIEWFEQKVKSGFRAEFLYERKLYSLQYDVWKESIRKQDAQLRRIVRYLKAWCDYRCNSNGAEMPCGIILTILAAENYSSNGRDDISLRDTLINIQTALQKEFVCMRPTTPENEDLLKGYEYKTYFMAELSFFVESAKQAINEGNEKRACGKWQSKFGNRFSCAMARDYDENASSFGSPAIITVNAKSA